MKRSLIGISLAAISLHSIEAQSSQPVRYTVTDLGPVGAAPGQPIAIKNNGLIAGDVQMPDKSWHAVLWFQGMKLDIAKPGLGGANSIAFGSNERGQTVGQAENAKTDPNGEDFCGFASQHTCLPFLWQGGKMTSLPLLKDSNGASGLNGGANAINNRGQIAGISETTERDPTCPPVNPALLQYQKFKFKPVIWENNKVRELPTYPGDPDGIAFAMNDKGQVVGASGTCTSMQINGDLTYLDGLHPVFWDADGTLTSIGDLGGIAPGGGNVAINMNNRGQVIGVSGTSGGAPHAFLWSKASAIQDLGTVQDDISSVALGINDNGDVVGISFDANFNPRAFLRLDGGISVDLNSLVDGDSRLFLFDACSINSDREIIGMAADASGEVHGFLATPNSQDGTASASMLSDSRLEHARKLLQQRSFRHR